jgi:hypothetical protein
LRTKLNAALAGAMPKVMHIMMTMRSDDFTARTYAGQATVKKVLLRRVCYVDQVVTVAKPARWASRDRIRHHMLRATQPRKRKWRGLLLAGRAVLECEAAQPPTQRFRSYS